MATRSAKPLILASASPRRRELLRAAGYEFTIIPPTIDEPAALASETSPLGLAEALSYYKACSVATGLACGTVIGADTIVAFADQVFGKPADANDARRILGTLMHNSHQVITGVTLLDASTGRRTITHEVTSVTMRPMTDEQFEDYLRSGLWQGKAGAYGVQDHDDRFVQRLDGSFTNVVGLPMELLGRLLAARGHHPRTEGESPSRGA
jgi:septum formation protein